MEDRVEKIAINYGLIGGKDSHGGHCTFCGGHGQVSDYAAGRYVIQVCGECAESPLGMVDVVKVLEEKSEIKKKKK